jgi:hypothetical protein
MKVEGAFGAKSLRITMQVLGKHSRVMQDGSGAPRRQRRADGAKRNGLACRGIQLPQAEEPFPPRLAASDANPDDARTLRPLPAAADCIATPWVRVPAGSC